MKIKRFLPIVLALLLLTGCGAPEPMVEDGGLLDNTDSNAPKAIASTEIKEFSCSFHLWEEGTVTVKATRTEDGAACSFRGPEGSEDFTFAADAAFMEKLQAIVKTYDFAQHNGLFSERTGLPDMFGVKLSVLYASGETISAYDNQDPFLPEEALKEMKDLFLKKGETS